MKLYDANDTDHDGLLWLQSMACEDLDPDDFFVEPGHVIDPAVAATCRRCPVRAECVTHAYKTDYPAGYFGNLSPSFRKKNKDLDKVLVFLAEDTAAAEREYAERGGSR